jgi:hypothetical protein
MLTLSTQQRDRVLADRAQKTLRFHMKRAGTILRCDPYANVLDVERPAWARAGLERTRKVLERHSLPGHLLNALLRQWDPETTKQAAAQPEYQSKPPAVAVGSSATP